MTDHPSLAIPKSVAKDRLSEIQRELKQEKIIQVLPLDIIEPLPIIQEIGNAGKLTAEALAETSKALLSLKESVDSPSMDAKIDQLLSIFAEIRDNEKAFFVKVEAELNR